VPLKDAVGVLDRNDFIVLLFRLIDESAHLWKRQPTGEGI
jgi:hypothetical protein